MKEPHIAPENDRKTHSSRYSLSDSMKPQNADNPSGTIRQMYEPDIAQYRSGCFHVSLPLHENFRPCLEHLYHFLSHSCNAPHLHQPAP